MLPQRFGRMTFPVDYRLLVLLQRPQQQQEQQQYVLLQHPVLLQYTLLQHPLPSKNDASASSDISAAASHANAAAVFIHGSTSTHIKVDAAATFGQKMSSVWAYFTKLHRRFRPRGTMLPTSPGRQGVSSVHPQRYKGLDPRFAYCIIFYCTPEPICQKYLVRI